MAVLLLAAGLVFAPSARADSEVRIVRLSLVEGAVQIDRGTGQGFEKAIMNMPVTQGMMISTENNARAEVEFENGTTLRLAPRTQVAFPLLGLRSSGAYLSAVQVNEGTAYFNVRHKGDDDFRVIFGNREVPVDRNVRFRLDLAGGNPELAVFSGELNVKGPSASVRVKKNETLTLDVGDPGRYDLAKNVIPEADDSWDTDRANYVSQYSSSSYSTSSPYYYGLSDLNYYGSWTSWPGYGPIWRPVGVGYGWDPFYNGAWAWYPGFGYTWVSTYPWGWTPYRYGSWIWVPNLGWCWRAGAWNTWYTVPPVYNAPPSFHAPKPPPPIVVQGAGGFTGRHPTVVVDNGVGVIRTPRGEGFVGGRRTDTITMAPAPATTTPVAPTIRNAPVAPAAGTPAPVRDPRPIMTRDEDRTTPARTPPRVTDRGTPPARSAGPPARVERSAPAAAPRSAPPPRMSAPPAVRSAPPPSGGGHSGAISKTVK